MGKTSLVGYDMETGSKILQILDEAGLQVKVAMWAILPEYEEWRLVLFSRKFDAAGLTNAFGLIHKALDAAALPVELTPSIVILRATDPLIRTLRKEYGKSKVIPGTHVGGRMLGDRFVEDAYAYRIS
jgi:hypothetical protein